MAVHASRLVSGLSSVARLNWGLVGGGEGSQIGPVHRMAARLDGEFSLAAGALDACPESGRAFALRLGIAEERAYGDWQDMLAAESARDGDDRLDLVTVATPNATHYPITRGFLEAGFNVLCEKPLTMTSDEAADIVAIARAHGRICAVNFGYSGYPLVREMRAMVRQGQLGRVRLVVVEFSHGHHAAGDDPDNPRIRWRYDPRQVGNSAQFADCGSHALHLASFVTGRQVERLSADFASCVPGRELEDDAMVAFRMQDGIVGRLWTSAVAVGRQHGLTLQVSGERGGLRWQQEQANQLYWCPVGGRVTVIERGEAGLSADAERASRIAVGHVEGMPLAFANVYADLALAIRSRAPARAAAAEGGADSPDDALLYPIAEDGFLTVAATEAAVRSAKRHGAWEDVPAIQDPKKSGVD